MMSMNHTHHQPVFDNVLSRDFDAQKPDQAYVSDITCQNATIDLNITSL